MIQRIQTIFLFLAALSNAGLFALPWAASAAPTEAGVYADGRLGAGDHIAITVAVIAATVLALAAIGFFKNRKLQVQITSFSLLLAVAAGAFGGWLYYSAGQAAAVQPGWLMLAPVVVFSMLAVRYIRKDEKLVRSADRLR